MLRDAIPTGREHAQTKDHIAARLGWPVREFEEAVEQARKAGSLAVCSGFRGYWLPETASEYADNVNARRRRAVGQLVTVRGERRLLRRWQAETLEQGVLWRAA